MRFGMLTTNPIIDCALLAWFLAQLIKVILEMVLARRLDMRLFVSSGGMPSSHSALAAACTASSVTLSARVKPAALVRRRALMHPPHPRACPMSWHRVRT